MAENDPYAPPDDPAAAIGDDDAAATQAAIEAEHEARDEALSEDDGHDAEREELFGNGLLWWRDTSLLDAHLAMESLFEEVLSDFDSSKQLIEHGLAEDTMSVEMPLTFISGPLVLAGLQLLGLFAPNLRETIADIIKSFPFAVATPEEEAAIAAVMESVKLASFERAKATLAAAGIPVEGIMTADDFREKLTQERSQDAELGLDPN